MKYKNIFTIVFKHTLTLLLCAASSIAAHDCLWSVELRGAYFRFNDCSVQRVYNNGTGMVQGELVRRLQQPINIFFNIGYLSADGCSLMGNTPTELKLLPISAGLCYRHEWNDCIHTCLGLGPVVVHATINNCSDFVQRQLCEYDWGAVVKVNTYFHFYQRFFADIFFDYYHQKITFTHTNNCSCNELDASGFAVGAGLGVRFD